MTAYTIYLSHHSISRSREVAFDGTLEGAKRVATREFGGDYQDYTVVIADAEGYTVAKRKLCDRRWTIQ